MEDLICMPIVEELFYTLPEWDVPELDLKSGQTYFFRDSRTTQIVRYRDGQIKRYQADFMQPRRYEADPGVVYFSHASDPDKVEVPQSINLSDGDWLKLRANAAWSASFASATEPVANAVDGSDVIAVELPTYNFEDPSVWGGLPRERPATGGYWRDECFVYYQGLNDAEIRKFRPTFEEVPF